MMLNKDNASNIVLRKPIHSIFGVYVSNSIKVPIVAQLQKSIRFPWRKGSMFSTESYFPRVPALTVVQTVVAIFV
jgi:hypothetical protein